MLHEALDMKLNWHGFVLLLTTITVITSSVAICNIPRTVYALNWGVRSVTPRLMWKIAFGLSCNSDFKPNFRIIWTSFTKHQMVRYDHTLTTQIEISTIMTVLLDWFANSVNKQFLFQRGISAMSSCSICFKWINVLNIIWFCLRRYARKVLY